MPSHTNGRSVRDRAQLFWGKVRRLYYCQFGNGYIKDQLEQRKGECARCGTCCKLLLHCPFLDESEDPCRCRIYGMPIPNCKVFPLDERDIADRDLVMPDIKCGFHFERNGNGRNGGKHQAGHSTEGQHGS